jgi:hypothetical protein
MKKEGFFNFLRAQGPSLLPQTRHLIYTYEKLHKIAGSCLLTSTLFDKNVEQCKYFNMYNRMIHKISYRKMYLQYT